MFEGGLRKDIRQRVSMMRLGIVAKVYAIAMTVERELISSCSGQPQVCFGQGSSKRQGSGSTSGSDSSGGNQPWCKICNDYHWGPCKIGRAHV